MTQRAIIENYAQAIQIVKEMDIGYHEWQGGDWKEEGRRAVKQVIEDRMVAYLERQFLEISNQGIYDRRNGYYSRHLLTGLGDIYLDVPRTRTFSAISVLKAYARRCPDIDQMILGCFVLGLSTRKVGEALLSVLGERISPSTVSRVAKTLDKAVEAFHRRRLADKYKAIILDGVVLTKKTGVGAIKKIVLVALGIRHDLKKEVIDFYIAGSESEAEWERFLTNLYKRGLLGEGADVLCVDGGKGLLAALKTVYPDIPIQRCWAHKMRNIINKVKKKDTEEVKKDLRRIYRAKDERKARSSARVFADKWERIYPKAVLCLRKDIDDLLTFFRFKEEPVRKAVRTTNTIERRFREVRRRTRPMGVFSDRTSMERILYAVFTYENKKEGTNTPFLLTQNN